MRKFVTGAVLAAVLLAGVAAPGTAFAVDHLTPTPACDVLQGAGDQVAEPAERALTHVLDTIGCESA